MKYSVARISYDAEYFAITLPYHPNLHKFKTLEVKKQYGLLWFRIDNLSCLTFLLKTLLATYSFPLIIYTDGPSLEWLYFASKKLIHNDHSLSIKGQWEQEYFTLLNTSSLKCRITISTLKQSFGMDEWLFLDFTSELPNLYLYVSSELENQLTFLRNLKSVLNKVFKPSFLPLNINILSSWIKSSPSLDIKTCQQLSLLEALKKLPQSPHRIKEKEIRKNWTKWNTDPLSHPQTSTYSPFNWNLITNFHPTLNWIQTTRKKLITYRVNYLNSFVLHLAPLPSGVPTLIWNPNVIQHIIGTPLGFNNSTNVEGFSFYSHLKTFLLSLIGGPTYGFAWAALRSHPNSVLYPLLTLNTFTFYSLTELRYLTTLGATFDIEKLFVSSNVLQLTSNIKNLHYIKTITELNNKDPLDRATQRLTHTLLSNPFQHGKTLNEFPPELIIEGEARSRVYLHTLFTALHSQYPISQLKDQEIRVQGKLPPSLQSQLNLGWLTPKEL